MWRNKSRFIRSIELENLKNVQVECIHIGEDGTKQVGIITAKQVLQRNVDSVGRPNHVEDLVLRGHMQKTINTAPIL